MFRTDAVKCFDSVSDRYTGVVCKRVVYAWKTAVFTAKNYDIFSFK